MPKIPIDYSKGLIYKIVCKTNETLIYVGSTTNFTKRKNKHKCTCHNENIRGHNTPVYVMIRANGGWDKFNMIPVKEFPCDNNIQLTIEEERIRKEMQATLNMNRAFISEEEAKEIQRNYSQNYRQEHPAEVKEYHKKYAHENKAEIKEQKRKYQQEHQAELKEIKQKYYEANKAEVKEANRKYREAHAAELKEYDRLRKDEKHRKYEANKDEINKKAREKRLAKKLFSATIV